MKMTAKDIIECNACHVCDGELYEGWRVGCNDLVFRSGAEEAVEVVKQETKEKCQIAFRNFMLRATLANVSGESFDYEKEFAETMSII